MEKYTDQEFFYKQTPVNYDGIAKFTSIKGNTLGWNQLVQNGNFASTSGWTKSGASTFSVSNNVATFLATGQYQNIVCDLPMQVVGHKYLMKYDVKFDTALSASNQYEMAWNNGLREMRARPTVLTANTWQTVMVINESVNVGTKSKLYMYDNRASGWSNVQLKNIQIFDLTQMGLDISSPSEFTSLFPLPYYDYNQGTLIPFSGNGIKTTGKNRINIDDVQIGKAWNGASNTARAVVYAPCFPNTQYTLSFGTLNVDDILLVEKNTEDATTTQRLTSVKALNPFTFTTSAESFVFGFQFNKANISASDLDGLNLQIEFGSSASSYEPYTSTTTSLPISTYFPTGMKSAGSVYDELTESKAITRIGRVDLGTLTWVLGGSGNFYDTPVINDLVPSSINIKSSRYTTGYSSIFENDSSLIGFSIAASKKIRFYNSGLSSASEVTSALSGVYLYYELATETETDAEDIFYKFYADGTEQILPVNGSTPTTAPIIADIDYYTKIDSNTPYRKFWLVNGNGDRWNLTEKELKSFLDSPQGLGFQKSIDVTRYGEMAYKNTETYNFPQLSGDILFYDTINATRYEKYNEFVRFLMVQPLTLYYQIPVSIYSGMADIYTLDCEVINLTKTESKTDRMLTCPIQIAGLEFFNGEEVVIQGTGGTFTIQNNSDFAVGFEITIEGGVLTNPYFTLSQNGEIYGEGKFVDSTYFSSVYVNSNDGEQDAILMRGSSVLPNPLSYQDLSIANGSIYVTFVKLARGVSELTVGAETGTIRNVNIKFKPKYRSV